MSQDDNQIIELIRTGRKLEAIKLVKETEGLGLKEAKDKVEELAKSLSGDEGPRADSEVVQTAGCMSLLLIVAAPVMWWLLS